MKKSQKKTGMKRPPPVAPRSDDELYAAALAERHVLTRPPLTTLPPPPLPILPRARATSSTRIPADHAASSRASRPAQP